MHEADAHEFSSSPLLYIPPRVFLQVLNRLPFTWEVVLKFKKLGASITKVKTICKDPGKQAHLEFHSICATDSNTHIHTHL